MIEVSLEHDLGRVKNVVQDHLSRRLYVPKIFLDAEWDGNTADVLAVDRAGVGDVHFARIAPVLSDPLVDWQSVVALGTERVLQELPLLKSVPAQFRYIVLVSLSDGLNKFSPTEELQRLLLAPDGVGRIGIYCVEISAAEPAVRVALKPERFRSSAELNAMADQFVATHTPNWEIRD